MKKIQYAVLLTLTIGLFCEIAGMNLMAAEEGTSSAQKESAFQPSKRIGRVILVSDDPGAEPPAETQIVFRPARGPEPAPKDNSVKRVTAKVFPFYNKLPRGEKCPVAIELTVEDGWHINANPSNPDFLIPTKVTLKTKQGMRVELAKVKYPEHKLHVMQQETKPYYVYDGKVMIYCLLEIDAKERSDLAELEFQIRYQACNDEQCEQPVTVARKGKMRLANPGDEIKKIYQKKFPKTKKKPAN